MLATNAKEKPVIIQMVLQARRPSMSRSEFRRYWQNVHAPLPARLPGLKQYSQNLITDSRQLALGSLRGPWEIDGISELVFGTNDGLYQAMSSDAYRAMVQDSMRFVGEAVSVAVQRSVVIPLNIPASAGVKCILLLTRKPQLTSERFIKEWQGAHVDVVGRLPNLVGYTQNLVVAREIEQANSSYEALPIDGITELWFHSAAETELAFHSLAAGIAQAHAHSFIAEVVVLLVEHHNIM
jgi:uncharacterized protein (TIGR02118 family)